MDELVKALRNNADHYGFIGENGLVHLLTNAADSIEELLSERDEVNADSWKTAFEVERDEHRWIPVEKRLPQICTNVLVAGRMKYRWEHKYLQFVDKAYFNEGEFFETSNDWYEGQDEFEITHWMPLPEPPKEE